MVYERVQKNSSSWSPAFQQEKSESLFKPRPFSIPTQADTDSAEEQEIPAYSRADRDAISAKLLNSMEAYGKSQVQTESQKPELESEELESDEVSAEAETLQRTSELPSPKDDKNLPSGGAVQRQEESSESEDNEMKSVQTKLTIGAPGDKYEQEADTVAAQVMSMSERSHHQPIQRREMPEEEQESVQTKPLQRAAKDGSSQTNSDIESQLSSSKGGGSPLPGEVRSFMEPRFGADFSQVRVHTGSAAVQMNKELGAQAFTHGQDIYFGAGKSPDNSHLTAHELTHVVQQNGGVVQRQLDDQRESAQMIQMVELQNTEMPMVSLQKMQVRNFTGNSLIQLVRGDFNDVTKADYIIYKVVEKATDNVVYIGQTLASVGTGNRFAQHLREKAHWTKATHKILQLDKGNWTQFEACAFEQWYMEDHGGLSFLPDNKIYALTAVKYDNYYKLHPDRPYKWRPKMA